MGQASWQFAVTTMPTDAAAAEIVDFLDKPAGARYTRRRSGYCELELEIVDEDDAHIVEGAGFRRGIVALRNGVERFFGTIVESHENADGYTIGARDPYYTTSWRRIAPPDVALPEGYISYTSLGDAEIAMRLIELTNAWWPTWLVRGDINSGGLRTRKFQQGSVISDKVEYMGQLAGSFVFKIDPLPLGTIGAMAEFNTATAWDVLKPKAIFAYGDGTLANCIDFDRTLRPFYDKVYIAYGSDIATGTHLPAYDAYGLWEDQRGQVDTTNELNAAQAASHAVQEVPLYDIAVTPGPDAPQLFDDFDIFDAVPVMLRRHGRTIVGNRPVTEVTLVLDPDSGDEQIEEIVLIDEDIA